MNSSESENDCESNNTDEDTEELATVLRENKEEELTKLKIINKINVCTHQINKGKY